MKHPNRFSSVLLAFVGILGGFSLSPAEAQAQSPTAQRPAGKPSTKVQHEKTSPALLQAEEGIITTTARRIPLNVRPDVFGTAEATSTQTAQRLPSAQNSRTKTSAEAVSTMLRKSDIQEIGYNANGTLRFAEGRFGSLRSRVSKNVEMSTPYTLVANAEMRSQDAETRAAQQAPIIRETFALLKENTILRGLERPEEELSLMSLTSDRLGFQHIRFEQTYKGLRVHGRDVYVHADAKGDVYSVHGLYEPTPTQEHSAIPTLTQESAFIATRNALAENGLWKSIAPSVLELFGAERAWKGELLWYPVTETENPRLATTKAGKSALRLAFAITVSTSIKRSWTYFIDAHSGEVLYSVRLHRDDQDFLDRFRRTDRNTTYSPEVQPTSSTKSASTLGTASGAEVDKSGNIIQTPPRKGGATLQSSGFIDVPSTTAFGENVSVRSWRRESDGRIFPVSDYLSSETPADQLPSRINGGSVILDARNTEVEDVSNAAILSITEGQRWRRDIASALSYADSCRRYFALRHKRTSWNGQGARMHTLLNVGNAGSTSAWWNVGLMSQGYGDGGGVNDERHPNRDLFLYGHEVGHAYNSIARLEYNDGETGALEEHFANLWGWMLDRTTNYYSPRLRGYGNVPGEGLHWGEADSTGAGWQAVRNMRDFFVVGTPRAQGLQFPHANAPIADRVSWLFFRRYGRDTTERIWWRTLATYMTQNAGFGDWRRHTLRSAEDLYPGNTALANALNAAFDDVGITASMPTVSRKISDGTASELTAVTSVIAFTTQAGRIGIYNPATNRASLFAGNDALVRTQGGRSQVSAANNARLLYFVNTRGQVATLDLMTNAVNTFSGIQIRAAGDIASVTISPDGRSLAMTSTDANDANVYLVTVATISATGITRPRIIPLKRLVGATTRPLSEGKQVSGIRYPDAISWSPDSRNLCSMPITN
ncbi:MAG: M4 family metallopeptidase [Candidatus Kapabacteria bacterium]|jgi:Zn-dependent metalloprotease|nr:M4 family metallopeptidase [Candidatus Kapabacteria bacterium]